jgi:hypothetical protein
MRSPTGWGRPAITTLLALMVGVLGGCDDDDSSGGGFVTPEGGGPGAAQPTQNPAPSQTPPPSADQSGPQPTQTNLQRDAALIGRWRYTSTATSGQFTMASDTWMTIRADGTYRYGDTSVAGGGPGVSGSSRGGGATEGQWHTRDRIVYVRDSPAEPWEAYARYYVEGDSLMFTFGNGSREVWKRQ